MKHRTLRTLTLALTSAAAAQQPLPSGGVLRADQGCYDVKHYELKLDVDPAAKTIRGTLKMTAVMTADADKIALDLDYPLDVEWVTARDLEEEETKPCASIRGDGRIEIVPQIELDEGVKFEVTVAYGGTPRVAPNPPWKGGFTWATTSEGEPWIATSCQGDGADLWWPCKDHPSDKPDTMDLHITVPTGLICASNGVLMSEKSAGDKTTFHWHVKNPINNYCVALNIAPYEVIETEFESVAGDTMPVYFYALPSSVDNAKKLLPEILDHLEQMEEICGPYPFRNEKYGVVETPHLGMEHQTIIAYGYRFRKQAPGYDWLHHHEMAHEWWANLVTCRDWSDMWIHEGIGTYMQALYIESRFGVEAMQRKLRGDRRGIMNRTPVAPDKVRDSHQIYFSTSGNDIYYKGAAICHTLRWLLGDEVFFKVLRRWAYPDPAKEKVTDGSQVRLTDTNEIIAIAEKVSGRKLGWFFDLYVRQARLPSVTAEVEDGTLRLSWRTPDDLPFPMPIPVRIGDTTHRVEMKDGRGQLKLPATDADWTVDPDGWLLRNARRRR